MVLGHLVSSEHYVSLERYAKCVTEALRYLQLKEQTNYDEEQFSDDTEIHHCEQCAEKAERDDAEQSAYDSRVQDLHQFPIQTEADDREQSAEELK